MAALLLEVMVGFGGISPRGGGGVFLLYLAVVTTGEDMVFTESVRAA